MRTQGEDSHLYAKEKPARRHLDLRLPASEMVRQQSLLFAPPNRSVVLGKGGPSCMRGEQFTAGWTQGGLAGGSLGPVRADGRKPARGRRGRGWGPGPVGP